jgi:hypothetical protein
VARRILLFVLLVPIVRTVLELSARVEVLSALDKIVASVRTPVPRYRFKVVTTHVTSFVEEEKVMLLSIPSLASMHVKFWMR